MELGFARKVAIVTGGSMDIGKATALALAREGAKVAICARGMEALKETAREIQGATGATVIPIRADVTSGEDIKMLVWSIVNELGNVDILVNNAVNSVSGKVTELPDEAWLNHIHTKVIGYIRCAREVVPSMRRKGGGCIVNIAGWRPATPALLTPALALPTQRCPT
jgi:3-oxoacyl-[acyl-carrier protein] reductase